MTCWLNFLLLCLQGCLLLRLCEGTLKCQCNTQDCQIEGKTTCNAEQYCYVEFFKDMFTRGCINDRTPLLCENRKPKNLNAPWPIMFCCKDSNFCNRNVLPTLPIQSVPEDPVTPKVELEEVEEEDKTKCTYSEDNLTYRSKSEGAKIINPIYIAVPVAGVCVLLALIIFAMYLLRRRNDNFQGYHYHEHLSALHKQCNGKKPVTTCSSCGKVNRCTDSERSSSGSETKLFLQV